MDVTPPTLLRRLGVAIAGLAVAALAAVACALSFDDLRQLAITGQARTDLAFLYPAGFDALLLVSLVGLLLLRSARPLVRAQAALLLVVLLLAAAALSVARPAGVSFAVRPAALGVALAPWVMLALGLWIWLLLIKHVQSRRTAVPDEEGTAERDIVPFVVKPRIPETTHGVSERVTRWAAPEPEKPEEPEEPQPEPEPQAEPEPEPEAVPEPEPEPEQAVEVVEEEDKPVRWGDRTKPTDVLVHPKVTERDTDTQPVRVMKFDIPQNPDPEHGPEAADPEPQEEQASREQPYGDAPSGRLRSTPIPPEPED